MKKLLLASIYILLKLALWFRYRIKVEGLDKISPSSLKKPGGVLFLPNHPAVFIDPVAVTLALWKKFPLRPMMIEYMYYDPAIHKLALMIDALPVPNFDTSSNSIKRKRNEAVFQAVIDGLEEKQNFLIYPAGRTKSTSLEILGGASGVHKIIQAVPEVNVVLVRIKGLWGSSFSRAFTGTPPPMGATILKGIKQVLKNLIFFTPRRSITISFEQAPDDFPYKGTRLEMNKYLEAWYNRPDGLTQQRGEAPGDSLMLVPYSIWNRKLPEIPKWQAPSEDAVPLSSISEDVQKKVLDKLAQIADTLPQNIKPEMTLAFDLGLDSLDMAELIAFLRDDFDVEGVLVPDLTTVNKLMAYADHKIVISKEPDKLATVNQKWDVKGSKKRVTISPGKTIPEVFLNTCAKMGKNPAFGDDRTGIMSFADVKLRAILLAEYIRHLPGDYIGILLPSSAGASLLILAVQLAGKVPLMINWTVGPRHLEYVAELSNVQVVLSAWSFIDRLENVEFNGIEDKLLMLEEIRPKLGLKEKLLALWRSKQSTKTILKKFNVLNKDPNSHAVLLFTSGTESMPKGVPLSHHNILANQRDGLNSIELYSDDVLLAILPPFHSFGFTISSLYGILAGFRTAFYPNPTDGKGLASAFERWKVTVICGAPTFIKGMLKIAKPEQLKTMRLCATGAEKTPPDLFALFQKLCPKACIIEGYGITECAPALTFNRPGRPSKGVGQPLGHVEIKIIHPETNKVLPIDTQGMIIVRGPNVFSGYINPGATSPFIEIEGQDWYKTGDLGYLDAENALTISGRMKRFVKIGGEMVSLGSIESSLLQSAHDKGWLTSSDEGPSLAVCSIESEAEKTKLFLFTRFDVSLDEINKTLRECGFSNLIRMTSVQKLDEIPIMGTGKVNYRQLESQYLANGDLQPAK
ncbi:MAG: 2-acyl-glycerophospho-ethanolamine acyltransferase [Chlamydiales bacterium 38-26]|nr:AMP-binding protein [Chlamydiales bacterium]OJV09303.1 MAG: 2-acyl-glycerophospho-ethanolamine acyltransferase [Chlamydiales bacterium 38-26]